MPGYWSCCSQCVMGNAAFFAAMLIVGSIAIVLARKTAPKTIALIASLVIIDVLVVGTWIGLEKVVERIQDTEITIVAGGKSESVEARTALRLAQGHGFWGCNEHRGDFGHRLRNAHLAFARFTLHCLWRGRGRWWRRWWRSLRAALRGVWGGDLHRGVRA